jgi:hypothetical protein
MLLRRARAAPAAAAAASSLMMLIPFSAALTILYSSSSLVGAAAAAAHGVLKPPPPPTPAGIAFDPAFGSTMVLQQAPAKACVTGTLGGGSSAKVAISGGGAGDSRLLGYEVSAVTGPDGNSFKACLQPQPAGGSFTVTATCTGCPPTGNSTAVITAVTFGDVWYCGGQSNMALPLAHTLSRNISRDAILAGKYENVRIHGIAGNMNPFQPWATLKVALADRPHPTTDVAGAPGCGTGKPGSFPCDSDTAKLMSFSSTCFYFGLSISDELAKAGPPPPIGLVHTAFGGSTIEQWLTNETIATCGGSDNHGHAHSAALRQGGTLIMII